MKQRRLLAAVLSVVLLLSLPLAVSAAREPNAALALQFKGDVNGDGTIDTTDARLILQHTMGKETGDFDTGAANVNGDWYVNTTDARLVLQYAVGQPVTLYPQHLPYHELTYLPQTSEPINATLRETGDGWENGGRDRYRPSVAQSVAEWTQLNAAYGFASTYNNTFFTQNAVLALNVFMPSINQEISACRLFRSGNTLQIALEAIGPFVQADAAYWVTVLVELPREALADVDTLAVHMNRRVRGTAKLVVNEQEVSLKNPVIVYLNEWVELPLLATMTALGAAVEPQGEGLTKITYNGEDYVLDLAAQTLVKAGDTEDLLLSPPGHTAYIQRVDDELMVDSITFQNLLIFEGITVTVDDFYGTVNVRSGE